MGNLIEELCVECNENAPIDFVRCQECQIDNGYFDVLDFEPTLDWNN